MIKFGSHKYLLLAAMLAVFSTGLLHGAERKGDDDSRGIHFDAVIIGGGLAGLSAAYELNGYKIIVLEKEEFFGGRVCTQTGNGIVYEQGAIFAYHDESIPFDVNGSPLLQENNPIGLAYDGNLYLGDSVNDVIRKARLKSEDMRSIQMMIAGETSVYSNLSPQAKKIVNAFFKFIHPGEPDEYIPARISDAFVCAPIRHHANGNQELIEAFQKRITGRMTLNAEVVSIENTGDGICTTYITNGKKERVSSTCAIIATTASVARKIIKSPCAAAERFLAAVKYGKGIVVTFAVKGESLHNIKGFRYIVTPFEEFNTIIQTRFSEKDTIVLTVYYTDKVTRKFGSQSMEEIVDRTKSRLRALGIGYIDPAHYILSDVRIWPELGTIISNEAYNEFDIESLEPIPNVFLAGDYTYWDTSKKMPYGMASAILSGRRAAGWVRESVVIRGGGKP